jgi:hypothetical protein
MTVKCLSTTEKQTIVFQRQVLGAALTDLAFEWQHSRRTIIRVLEEAGVDPGVKHRKPKASPVPAVNIPPKPIPTRTSRWKRVYDWIFPNRYSMNSHP